MVRMSEHNEEQRYIGDVGAPLNGPREEAAVGFGMVVLALAVGFAVGFAVWAVSIPVPLQAPCGRTAMRWPVNLSLSVLANRCNDNETI